MWSSGVRSAFLSKIPHYVSLPWDARLSAVPFVWSQTYSSLFILRSLRHVGGNNRCDKDLPAPACQRFILHHSDCVHEEGTRDKINTKTLYFLNAFIAAFFVTLQFSIADDNSYRHNYDYRYWYKTNLYKIYKVHLFYLKKMY